MTVLPSEKGVETLRVMCSGTWCGLTPAMNRLALLVFVLGGCFGGVAGDAKDDSFGGANADGTILRLEPVEGS